MNKRDRVKALIGIFITISGLLYLGISVTTTVLSGDFYFSHKKEFISELNKEDIEVAVQNGELKEINDFSSRYKAFKDNESGEVYYVKSRNTSDDVFKRIN